MRDANDHYKRLYGDFDLHPEYAARWVFASGWNSAIEEMIQRVNAMPFGNDTRASFTVYLGQMVHIDPNTIADHMQ